MAATDRPRLGAGWGEYWPVALSGSILGGAGVLLSVLGNPRNSGICVSCFLENIAGSLGFHQDRRMMYLRPEIMGFLLGAWLISLAFREFRVRGGDALGGLIRFITGFFLMVGSSVFIGCPIKMTLRLSAGDLTAVAGAAGLAGGVLVGVYYLRRGFTLGRVDSRPAAGGWIMPGIMLLLLVALWAGPQFISISGSGPGSLHPVWFISLGAGLLVGATAQRTRFCVTGGLRNLFLTGDMASGVGLVGLLLTAFVLAATLGQFHLGMADQPGAHVSHLWNFLGLFLVGFGSVLIDGCPFRQLILSGEGSLDAGFSILGMLLGGGAVYSWGIRSTTAGPTAGGRIAVVAGLIFCFLVANASRRKV